jgi:uncharacterized protein
MIGGKTIVFDDLDPNGLYPPVPEPDDLTTFFWEGVKANRLMILRCDQCGFYVHWPRPVCNRCLSTSLEPAEMSGDATLATWTFPSQPFEPYYQKHLPYALAVVELVEQPGLKMVTNLVDYEHDELHIEIPVRVTFREVAPGLTLPLFAPATAHEGGK